MRHTFTRLVQFALAFFAIVRSTGRPRRLFPQRARNAIVRSLRSPSARGHELFCPRNINGDSFFVKKNEKISGCGDEYDLCNGNAECGPGLMCCLSGCIYKCVVAQKLRRPIATDWIEEPRALTVGGSAWLIQGDGKGHSPYIDCSTSTLPGIEPTGCPTGYSCSIREKEDSLKQVPNRGICVRRQSLDGEGSSDDAGFHDELSSLSKAKGCYIKGKEITDRFVAVLNCKICFCVDGKIFCRATPCQGRGRGQKSKVPSPRT